MSFVGTILRTFFISAIAGVAAGRDPETGSVTLGKTCDLNPYFGPLPGNCVDMPPEARAIRHSLKKYELKDLKTRRGDRICCADAVSAAAPLPKQYIHEDAVHLFCRTKDVGKVAKEYEEFVCPADLNKAKKEFDLFTAGLKVHSRQTVKFRKKLAEIFEDAHSSNPDDSFIVESSPSVFFYGIEHSRSSDISEEYQTGVNELLLGLNNLISDRTDSRIIVVLECYMDVRYVGDDFVRELPDRYPNLVFVSGEPVESLDHVPVKADHRLKFEEREPYLRTLDSGEIRALQRGAVTRNGYILETARMEVDRIKKEEKKRVAAVVFINGKKHNPIFKLLSLEF